MSAPSKPPRRSRSPSRRANTKHPGSVPTSPRRLTRAAKSWSVYAIIDPRTDALFYVGQTSAFARRKAQHLEGTDQVSGLVISQIIAAGFLPHFVILETHDDEETALRAEIFWIETLLARGVALTNSQAFDGYDDRTAKRAAETRKLARMQQLRAVANGRTAKRTRLIPSAPDVQGWSPAALKRLKGMQENGIPIKTMARMLDRPIADVRAKLAAELLS
jgi:predicted GIY-YIG superfamily endonuclease